MATERATRPLKGPSPRQGATIQLDPRDLLRKLQRLDKITKAKIARKVLRSAARPILNDAKVRVPEDTGELKRSLKIRTIVNVRGASASVRATARHAHLVELGTKPHSMKRRNKGGSVKHRRRHPGTAPNPFLRPAFDSKQQESIRKAREILAAEIRKVTRGGK